MLSSPINNNTPSVRETEDRQDEAQRDQTRREAKRTNFVSYLLNQQQKAPERAAAAGLWGQPAVAAKARFEALRSLSTPTAETTVAADTPAAAELLAAEAPPQPVAPSDALLQLPPGAEMSAHELLQSRTAPPAAPPPKDLMTEVGLRSSPNQEANLAANHAELKKAAERAAGRTRDGNAPVQAMGKGGQADNQSLLAGGWMQPTPLAQQQAPSETNATARPAVISLEMIQQLVEFASVSRNQAGDFEFRLGLLPGVLGGMQICVAAYGNRRIGLKLRGAAVNAGQFDAELGALVDELRKRRVEVVEIIQDTK